MKEEFAFKDATVTKVNYDRVNIEKEMANLKVLDYLRLQQFTISSAIAASVVSHKQYIAISKTRLPDTGFSCSEFDAVGSKSCLLCEITRIDGHWAPILVPIESPYVIYY